jgi:DMSO/TMAO reductase YedYZ molybdopterin-dependent catalytic subunit
MKLPNKPANWLASASFCLGLAFAVAMPGYAQNTVPAATLKIDGKVATPLTLSEADLKAMPRKTVKVVNEHEKKTQVYQGVLLSDIFQKAGAPMGHDLRGAAMTTYVIAEASDGYRVIFSMAELDSDFTDSDAIVADTVDGAPLGANEGPFKLVVPHDKRPARWVRMLQSLTVSQLPK